MPKLFSIQIEVEEVALGTVMRKLNQMPGVAKLNLDMGDPEHASNGAGNGKKKRQKYAKSGAEFLEGIFLRLKKPVHSGYINEAFEKAGRGKSASGAINSLKTAGLIASGPDGYFATAKLKNKRAE